MVLIDEQYHQDIEWGISRIALVILVVINLLIHCIVEYFVLVRDSLACEWKNVISAFCFVFVI